MEKLRIYIPALDKGGNPVSPELRQTVIDGVIHALTSTCGGATSWEAEGYWLPCAGAGMVAERVRIIETIVPEERDAEKLGKHYSKYVLTNLNQESVLYEVLPTTATFVDSETDKEVERIRIYV